MNKIIEYEVVRIVTMVLVVMGHCTYYDIHTDFGGMDLGNVYMADCSDAAQILWRFTAIIYSFHMPLFMALSGAVFSLAIKRKRCLPSFKDHLSGKWKRLMVPMLTCALLFSIPLKFMSGYWDTTGWGLAKDIFYGQILMIGNANSHLWFLQALFLIFLFSWCIERLNLRKNRFVFYFVLLGMYWAISFTAYRPLGYLKFINLHNALAYLLWFYLGFEFELRREAVNKFLDKVSAKHLLYLVPLFCLLCLNNDRFSYSVNTLLSFLSCVAGMAITYFACHKISKSGSVRNFKYLTALSAMTFGLYLYSDPINYPVLAFLKSHGHQALLYTNYGAVLLYVVRFVMSFAVAWLVIMIVDAINKSEKKIFSRM